MTSLAVWLDHNEAKIFSFQLDGVKEVKVHAAHHLHHTSKDVEKKHDATAMYHELAGHLADATEILLLGPGVAKTQFLHHLESHHHAAIFAKVIGTETCDHPTDPQLIALAQKFFKKQHGQ